MSTKPLRVLVIEDTMIAQIAAATVLESLGCHVDTVNDGRSAIEKTRRAQYYDVIFLDLGLPDVDALTVTENILENYRQRDVAAPRIIALTAHAYDSLREESQKAGMSNFLAKPLTEEVAREILGLASR